MYHYIAIERQYCSGGQEIAELLSQRLGYKLCDHGILVETAKRLKLPAVYISNLEETAEDNPIFNLAQTALGGLSKKKSMPLSEQIFEAEKQVILDEAAKGDCIFLGRCAGPILEEAKIECLRVFIGADMPYRLGRALNVENISNEKLLYELRRNEKRRVTFFNAHTKSKWGSKEYFPICLNTGLLGIEQCVDIILAAVGK